MTTAQNEWPLWEVFVRSKQGLEHKHCGSLHAADAQQALQMARMLGVVGCWVVMVWSRCVSVILRWLVLAGAAACTHGSLRIAPSEARAGGTPPGVPLAVALGFRCGPAAAVCLPGTIRVSERPQRTSVV